MIGFGLIAGACSSSQDGAPGSRLGLGDGGGPGGGYGRVTPAHAREFKSNVGDVVYFSSDSTQLTPEAQRTLQNQARWLQQHGAYAVTVEGHADERGTREYDIALGARRAETVKAFLVSNGVAPGQLRTVSLCKERPVAVCNDISCWSQNRRAQTVLGLVATASRF